MLLYLNFLLLQLLQQLDVRVVVLGLCAQELVVQQVRRCRSLILFFQAFKDELLQVLVHDEVYRPGLDPLGHLLVYLLGSRALLVGTALRSHLETSHAKCIDVYRGAVVFAVNFRRHELRSAQDRLGVALFLEFDREA